MGRLPSYPQTLLLALVGLLVAGYWHALVRSFASEDFMLLRYLANGPFWETTWSHLTGPLLGIDLVTFYRPLAATLLHLEYLIWGVEPLGYMVTHLAIHALNVVLTYQLMRSLLSHEPALYALGVALVFGIYPLHPNTVSFIAAYASLLSTTFVLASLLVYQHYERCGRVSVLMCAVGLFGAALGCYEQAVVLPAMVIAFRLLGRTMDKSRLGATDLVGWSVLIAVLSLYLLIRSWAIGEVIGGYRNIPVLLTEVPAPQLLERFLVNFTHLVNPTWQQTLPGWVPWGLGGVVAILSGIALCKLGSNRLAGVFCLSLAWISLSQLPFLLYGIVPANARYWYLTCVGAGLFLVVFAAGLSHTTGRYVRRVSTLDLTGIIVVLVSAYYVSLLQDNTKAYASAASRARQIQQQLGSITDTCAEHVFVRGHPLFQTDKNGTPVAQIFLWGLSDSLLPPFRFPGACVYPLKDLSDEALLPIFEKPRLGQVWQWDEQQQLFQPVAPDIVKTRGKLGKVEILALETDHIRFRPVPDLDYQIVLVAPSNMSIHPIGTALGAGQPIQAALPERVISSVQHLYPGPLYTWVEGRNRLGQLVTVSRLLTIDRKPRRGFREAASGECGGGPVQQCSLS